MLGFQVELELTLVDVGEDTTLGNSDVTQKLVQFLIVADGELKVTRDDTDSIFTDSIFYPSKDSCKECARLVKTKWCLLSCFHL